MFDTTPNGIINIISLGESDTVEFKTRFSEKAIARHLTAFANSRGGIVIIGVGDRKEVLGCSQDEVSTVKERLDKLVSALLPSTLSKTGVVPIDGKMLVYAVVEKAPDSIRPIRLATGDALAIVGSDIVPFEQAIQRAQQTTKRVSLFIAMSFRQEEEPALVDYYEAMRRAVKQTGLPIGVQRMDSIEGDYEISQQIMEEIDKADLVLADFTLSSANVYFELGYARAKGKRIIQCARKGTTLEFDTRNWRTIIYKNASELESALVPALNDAYVEKTRESSSSG